MRKDLQGPKTTISDLAAIKEFLMNGGSKEEYFDANFNEAA